MEARRRERGDLERVGKVHPDQRRGLNLALGGSQEPGSAAQEEHEQHHRIRSALGNHFLTLRNTEDEDLHLFKRLVVYGSNV